MKFDHRFVLTEAEPSMRVYRADGVTARLDFFDHILRVAILKTDRLLPTWSVCPDGVMPLTGRDKLVTDGPDILIDDGKTKIIYRALCSHCYYKLKEGK